MRIFKENPALNSDQKVHWRDLTSSGLALALTEASLNHDGLTVVITNSAKEASYQRGAIEFFSKGQDLPILIFPDWETLPYDIFSPHQDIISGRLKTLAKLPTTKQGILLVPITTIMHRLAPVDFVSSRSFHYQVGDELDRDNLQSQLNKVGYNRVDTVYEHGEFAFRGSIIDIFPMGAKSPFRLDLLDTEVESLRLFDPESQRTIESVQRIDVLPAREFPLDKQSINTFLNKWHDCFDNNSDPCPVYRDVKESIAPQGIEYYSSLFFEKTATLFDYLPENILLFTLNDIETTADQFWNDINTRYIEYGVDRERPLLKPSAVFLTVDKIFHKMKNLPRTKVKMADVVGEAKDGISPVHHVPDVTVNVKLGNPLSKLESFLNSDFDGEQRLKVLFCAESSGRREVLIDLLKSINLSPRDVETWTDFLQQKDNCNICTFPLDEGIFCPENNLCLITESDLFGQQVMQRRRRSAAANSPDYIFKSLAELKVNAAVVHIEHGVGRYKGLVTLEVDKTTQEFLMLTYANDAKLYVPVSSIH
jgi:transcription-repair coupling factor (superfamily II helicase)